MIFGLITMYYPSLQEFKKLAKEASNARVFFMPVAKILSPPAEPIEVFENFAEERFSFFLDSARYHHKTGRFSFMGSEPFLIFKSKQRKIELIHRDFTEGLLANPINKLRRLFSQFRSIKIEGLPNFMGGAVGYFSYDVGRLFERLPEKAVDDLGLADIYLAFYDRLICFDHLENKIFIVANASLKESHSQAYEEAIEKIERLWSKLRAPSPGLQNPGSRIQKQNRGNLNSNLIIESNFTQEGFEEIIKRAKQYIRKGEIYQANLSQRLKIKTDISPFSLYKILRKINPSPFASYLNFDELKIVSSSPERLLKVEGSFVQTRPIAGTRPRGKDFDENLKLRAELLLNEKERAEHIMLVDLERNDLGRVCSYGTVRVDELMVLEEYSHVIHIVSNVCGKLHTGKDRFDLIRACFPGGTITGCPKIRCMEIIEELEPVRRGIYCGSMGYLSFNGDMDLNIAIRTFILKEGTAYIQVGAGIVADSDPTREYFETLYKAEGLLEAIKEAEADKKCRRELTHITQE